MLKYGAPASRAPLALQVVLPLLAFTAPVHALCADPLCCLKPVQQEEEDRRAAAAAEAETRLQRRFRELEAAEAAAEAQEQERGGGFWGGWLGGGGRRRGASGAAAAAAAGGGLPRAGGRGPRQQRSRRSPAAEAEFAAAMQGALFAPPLGGGYGGHSRGRGGIFGQALQQMLGGLHRGLPADLLLRWVERRGQGRYCASCSFVGKDGLGGVAAA